MYFFDFLGPNDPNNFNGFNCNIVPNNWGDYEAVYGQDFRRYTQCMYNSYNTKLRQYLFERKLTSVTKLNDSCYNNIIKTFNVFTTQITITRDSMTKLIAALTIATPNQPSTFDSSTYYDYITKYDEMADTGKRLDLMLTTGCGVIGIDNKVGIDTSVIGSKLTQQCTGVYMKQINNGSEFIGTVTDSNKIIPLIG